jgi:DNA polymerase
MNRKQIQILNKFHDWLLFQKDLGLEYLDCNDDLTALRQLLAPSPKGRTRGNHVWDSAMVKTSVVPGRPGNSSCIFSGRLAKLNKQVLSCTACVLSNPALKPLFGKGHENARLLVAGEMPARKEILKGSPFIGDAGDMLYKMLRAIRIEKSDVFLTNVIKCHTVRNNPHNAEAIEACGKLLISQIEIIKPSFILCFGSEAASVVLKTCTPVENLRNRIHEYPAGGAKVLVTYSPYFLLKLSGTREKELKRDTWNDLQLLEKIYHGRIS